MKKAVLTLLLSLFAFSSFATPKVYLNYYVFYDQNHNPYVETALQFDGRTLQFEADTLDNLQAELEITQIFKQGESIITADKYELLSPLMKDSIIDDFFDLKRFQINPGRYDFELIVKDLNSNKSVSATYDITVNVQNLRRMEISDIEFVQNLSKTNLQDNFTKNGYQLIPYFSNYFPPDYNKIVYYLEFYNADTIINDGATLAATFQIKNVKSNTYLETYFQYKKLKPHGINPIINVLPIDALASGKYELVIDVLNQNNDTLVHKEVPFIRRNNIEAQLVDVDLADIDGSFARSMPTDSLAYFLESLIPIAPQHEIVKIRKMIEGTDTAYMKKYFYSFWKETSPVEPLSGWKNYKMQVYYAQKLFGTQIKKGFESDRGRIHLQYGAPNYVTDQPNGTSAYPYQIWHYYRIGQRSNVRFVFYNPDLVTNDYPLIHADMPGEVQNQNWQQEILKRTSNGNGNQSIRGNSGIFFED
ncbi:MAG: GWxTD domain-containing protein [Crocinitomicaceae bacterium]